MTSTTSQSLLARAQQRDPDAWQRMSRLYVPIVYAWGRQAGLQECDASDVAQEVFRVVATKLSEFQQQQDGSFRGWLKAITRNKLKEFFRREANQPRGVGGTADGQAVAAILPADEDADQARDRRADLARRALELIKADFEETTWRAFLRFAVDNLKAADVADEFGMTPKAVRQAKCRILKRLRTELEGLD